MMSVVVKKTVEARLLKIKKDKNDKISGLISEENAAHKPNNNELIALMEESEDEGGDDEDGDDENDE